MELLIDKKTQSLVRDYIPPQKQLRALADFFSTLGDSTRIKILSALSITSMCVGDLTQMLELNQTTVSHQLKTLRDMDVVDYKRQGKVVFYYIKDRKVLDVMLGAVSCL